MTIDIAACRQGNVETDLLVQLSQLTFGKTDTIQSYLERSCKVLFPQDVSAVQQVTTLFKKVLPKLEKCNQHKQLSARRVVDIVIYALASRGQPTYCKKGLVKRTLIVNENEFYIILKSKGGLYKTTVERRVTLAVKVPFTHTKKASLVYQLSNTDLANKISVEELNQRGKLSERACNKFKPRISKKISPPRIVGVYSYNKAKQGATIAKACAFIRAKDTLASYNPTLDSNHKFTCFDDDLLKYAKNDDLDSVNFMLKHFVLSASHYSFWAVITTAAKRNNCAMLKALLEANTQIPDDTLTYSLPKTVETEDEKTITRLLINACKNKEEVLADAYRHAVTVSEEHVKFIWTLGDIPQKTHAQQLPHARDLEIVKLIASRIEDVSKHCGDAMEMLAYEHEWDKVFFLLEKGVAINYCRDNDGVTVLLHAVAKPESEKTIAVVQKLLDLGADPHMADEDGKTCIYFAAAANNTAIVKILLDRSLDKEADIKMIENAHETESKLTDSQSNSD